jgi:hypothetical protein
VSMCFLLSDYWGSSWLDFLKYRPPLVCPASSGGHWVLFVEAYNCHINDVRARGLG